jgi:ubiquinone/menaquinone biosynthesis C-methylase UbiE
MSTTNQPDAPTRPAGKKAYKGIGMEGFLARWYAKNTGRNIDDYRKAAEMVSAQVQSGGSVLEVAPGPGYLAIELARISNCTVVGLDISHSFVEMATQNAQTAGVAASFRQGDAAAMPFDDDAFHFIVCRAAFKNFARPVPALNEMYRVLKPGGKAVIIDLSKDASPADINATVNAMRLGLVNSAMTKLVFKHMLLKRAYRQEDFHRMAHESRFGSCQIRVDGIGLEVWLTRPAG